MAHIRPAAFDRKGRYHATPEAATVADLAAELGGGDEAERLARLFFTHRAEAAVIFAEHDAMLAGADNVRRLPVGGAAK